jgi:hypothetical protein
MAPPSFPPAPYAPAIHPAAVPTQAAASARPASAPSGISHPSRLAPTYSQPFRVQPTPPVEPRKTAREWLAEKLPLEAVLGMNLFAKIGIVLLVLGFALLGRMALVTMGPGGKVALLYTVAAALLVGGIWVERRERYRLFGRTSIGGGWALLFFTTYAMNHVAAMKVMHSDTLNAALLLAVAVATVLHTLRYNSQLVTGLAFLLGFSTVALTQDTVYALSAGVILALGIVTVGLRKHWYELEIFGIAASFGNHFYWLHRCYPGGVAGHAFTQFWSSTLILVLYWLVFRVSYVVRRIDRPSEERASTIAAILNTVFLLGVMKFQSTRPELAFSALAALGALEFAFGQLPLTRRRRTAFLVLTLMGSLLMFAAVPFKYSGNSIALIWMIAAEVLLVAGLVQPEVVFRRLGLIAGIVTGGFVAFEARSLIELRMHSEARLVPAGTQLLLCAGLFCANTLWVAPRWKEFFADFDGRLAIAQSWLGAALAFLGVWALLPGDWTAVGWACLMLAAAFGARTREDKHLFAHTWLFGVAAAMRAALFNCHLGIPYPHHLLLRVVTLPLLAVAFYASAWLLSKPTSSRLAFRALALLVASTLLAALGWLELPPMWVAIAWLGLAMALAVAGTLRRVQELCWQEHGLALLIAARLLLLNVSATGALDCYLPVVLTAAVFYAISRRCTLSGATYQRFASWGHTSLATGLLAALAWHKASQPWLAVVWILFALGLAAVDRVFLIEELPLQAHVLALLALGQAVAENLWLHDRWHGVNLQLLTLGIAATALYALTYTVRLREPEKQLQLQHTYSTAAGFLIAWLLWHQLPSLQVADGLALFGLSLFVLGTWKRQTALRLQSYVLVGISFLRACDVNLSAAPQGAWSTTRLATMLPVALVCFGVWAWLDREPEAREARWAGSALAWMGTTTVTALAFWQTPALWAVVALAALAVLLLASAPAAGKEVFLQQCAAMLCLTVARGLTYNTYGTDAGAGCQDPFAAAAIACALLLASLPLAFRMRARLAATGLRWEASRRLGLQRIEQWVFFAPIALVTLGIAERMQPGLITLAWGIEGLAAVLLGLAAAQRSFRITGLLLLLACVAKIVFRDAWRLSERDRYITFIALGAALMLVSMLYNRYRESVLKLL